MCVCGVCVGVLFVSGTCVGGVCGYVCGGVHVCIKSEYMSVYVMVCVGVHTFVCVCVSCTCN